MLVRHLEGILAGLLLALAVFLVALEILLRTTISYSLMNIANIASFLIIWSTFLGASQAIQQNVHVRVDILAQAVPARAAWGLEILVMALCLGFAVALAWSGAVLVYESNLLGERTVGILDIPMWIPQSVLPLAGCLFFFRFSQRLWALITSGPATGAPQPEPGNHHAGHS